MDHLAIPLLGAVVVMALAGAIIGAKAWPRKPTLTEEEKAELSGAPMPLVMKRALVGFIITAVTLGVIMGILMRTGAMAYWEDDNLRLTVLGIFLAGLFAHVLVTGISMAIAEARGKIDERDQVVIARAPAAQSALVLIGLAAWTFYLTRHFRAEGAVPVVYMYLIFGSMILLVLMGQSLGILLGYWMGGRGAKG
jgi:hypothetical protein